MQVKFKNWHCDVKFNMYGNKRTAIQLVEIDTNDPVLTASVNIPEVEMEDDEVAIKNYSENEGILDVLIETEIISKPVREVQTGFVTIPICKLLKKK